MGFGLDFQAEFVTSYDRFDPTALGSFGIEGFLDASSGFGFRSTASDDFLVAIRTAPDDKKSILVQDQLDNMSFFEFPTTVEKGGFAGWDISGYDVILISRDDNKVSHIDVFSLLTLEQRRIFSNTNGVLNTSGIGGLMVSPFDGTLTFVTRETGNGGQGISKVYSYDLSIETLSELLGDGTQERCVCMGPSGLSCLSTDVYWGHGADGVSFAYRSVEGGLFFTAQDCSGTGTFLKHYYKGLVE